MTRPDALQVSALRWRCDPDELGFTSTAEVDPVPGIVGQDNAVAALRFGLEINAPGQNVYVRGLAGTGRLTLVRKLLEEVRPDAPLAPDVCYVHNFEQPDRPAVIRLPRGTGDAFRDRIAELRRFIDGELATALRGELVQTRRNELEKQTMAEVEKHTKPLEEELEQNGLALGMAQAGGVTRPVVLPVIEGKPAPREAVFAMLQEGKLSEEELDKIEERIKDAKPRVDLAFSKVSELQRALRESTRSVIEEEAHRVLEAAAEDTRRDFPQDAVRTFVDGLISDVVHQRLPDLDGDDSFSELYEVNLLINRPKDQPSPVIVENAPSLRTLVGSVDATTGPDGQRTASHMSVHAGSLLRADGGVVVMEASEVLGSPGAWAALVRTLRSGRVELVPPDIGMPWLAPSIKPEPIEVNVKVVLLGESRLYYLLDQLDSDFPHLFKVLADFDDMIPRTAEAVTLYAGVIARIAKEEDLPPFDAGAVALLAEHGARIAASPGKLTARFGRLADIAREAAYLCRKREGELVVADDVGNAVGRTKARADGAARRFREAITEGAIRIATEGTEVGQVNGLAVIKAGPLTYGFPSRITATMGPGSRGAINIERESQLSGAIHTKAFYILGGLLRHLLGSDHPLTFEASIAFEQSYGGIDGDSASGAEICCLLSALTKMPVRQGLAMTGAIDQKGNILPIGAVNEKIEGFFDTCRAKGLTGDQGVIVPKTNVGDLMLRRDVVEACERGEFAVYPVDSILEALALFFDAPPGAPGPPHPAGTVLAEAVKAAQVLYERSHPPRPTPDAADPPAPEQAGGEHG